MFQFSFDYITVGINQSPMNVITFFLMVRFSCDCDFVFESDFEIKNSCAI